MPAPKRLRDLVRDIRSAKTAAEERAIVNRECAQIRDSFRDENCIYRCRSVAKLLYIHMLGYPAHFGQVECLRLIASGRFTDKRVGYLGAMMLLDEKSDVHLLVTNSLKNDLNHSNVYVTSLALCTLGSICSSEMSRDLAGEVERLIKSNNAYIKKKATLCAYRIIRKVPDLMEMFIPCARSLLSDKNHAILLSSICLITEMCERSPDTLAYFRKHMVPTLVRTLKTLIMTGYSPDHEINKISDPFLQVRILRLMRILGRGDSASSDAMNDILAQVATSTETSRNVGHAILYEIVLTIMAIESDPGLRVLAINILGRFLLNSDKNIRYVALNTLLRVVNNDQRAVQRHRTTIIECLADPDSSIQRRAIDLCFVLINTSTIQPMMKELLSYLENCDPEFKSDVCSKIITAVDKFSPSKRWHIDTILTILTLAGNRARDDVVASLVYLISQSPELHIYSVVHLYKGFRANINQQPLVQVATWSIGEFGDLLISSAHQIDADLKVTEQDVLDLLQSTIISPVSTHLTRVMIINCLMKLSVRFSHSHLGFIQNLIGMYSTNMDLELQQRSVEYGSVFRSTEPFRAGLFACMPVFEPSNSFLVEQEESLSNGVTESYNTDSRNGNLIGVNSIDSTAPVGVHPGANSLLEKKTNSEAAALNLLDLLSADLPVLDPISSEISKSNDSESVGLFDLIPPISSSVANSSASHSQLIKTNPVDSSSPPASHVIAAPMTIYEAKCLRISLAFERPRAVDASSLLLIHMSTVNTGQLPIESFELQAAVPKSLQLQILPPSATSLLPGNQAKPLTQTLKISNPYKTSLRLRVRILFTVNGVANSDQLQLDSFPSNLFE